MSDAAIDFYFDFASPYAFLASHRVDEIGERHGRSVTWRPVMLGAMFKAAGTGPIVNYPLKGPYAKNDLARSARLFGVSIEFPDGFPHATLAAARGFYWLTDTDPDKAKPFARAFYAVYFGEGRNATPAEETAKIAASVGVDEAAFLEAVQDTAIKDRLKAETSAAIGRGVFGAPFIFVDDEAFWGSDRLDQVERWLETGGW
mgnify:CR=1 FL=1|jgi:2-hydroxychromene-2-carboxylate isomerase